MEWLVGIYLIGLISTWIFLCSQRKPSHWNDDQYILVILFSALVWPFLIPSFTVCFGTQILIDYFNKRGA